MKGLTHDLQRFIDKDSGPVISLRTVACPGFFGGRLWHSTCQLRPEAVPDRLDLLPCRYYGSAWSQDEGESRRKTVVETLERWAYNYYTAKDPDAAGLDINGSANGFAAMPADMGPGLAAANAYCEAAERWVLNSLWDGEDVFFEKYPAPREMPEKVLRGVSREWAFFGLKITPERIVKTMPGALHFRLCLLKTPAGGVVSGSACSPSAADALKRALLEAYIHAVLIKLCLLKGGAAAAARGGDAMMRSMRKAMTSAAAVNRALPGGSRSVLEEEMCDKRLVSFAQHPEGYRIVSEHLKPGGGFLHRPPPVQFSKTLPGPWDPEVTVHRVLLADSVGGEQYTGRCYFH